MKHELHEKNKPSHISQGFETSLLPRPKEFRSLLPTQDIYQNFMNFIEKTVQSVSRSCGTN